MVSPDRRLDEASALLVITMKLNQPDPPEPVRRVTELLELLKEADTRRQVLVAGRWKSGSEYVQVRKLARDINQKLLAYQWTPVITSVSNLTPVSAWSSAVAREVGSDPGGSDPLTPLWGKIHEGRRVDAEEWERMAVWYLIHRGYWERYRRCRQCQQWFYARTDFQTNCSKACRQKFVAKSEDFKKKRADYMKGYREGEKERNRRAAERNKRRMR